MPTVLNIKIKIYCNNDILKSVFIPGIITSVIISSGANFVFSSLKIESVYKNSCNIVNNHKRKRNITILQLF